LPLPIGHGLNNKGLTISLPTKVSNSASLTKDGQLHTGTNVSAGEGIIILLCGPPGVGKTLTAEAGKSRYSRRFRVKVPRETD